MFKRIIALLAVLVCLLYVATALADTSATYSANTAEEITNILQNAKQNNETNLTINLSDSLYNVFSANDYYELYRLLAKLGTDYNSASIRNTSTLFSSTKGIRISYISWRNYPVYSASSKSDIKSALMNSVKKEYDDYLILMDELLYHEISANSFAAYKAIWPQCCIKSQTFRDHSNYKYIRVSYTDAVTTNAKYVATTAEAEAYIKKAIKTKKPFTLFCSVKLYDQLSKNSYDGFYSCAANASFPIYPFTIAVTIPSR